ncbi:hypothetical protein NC651_019182 [Populus alba x Populus x berolinensis]|nr:hypothetical protein NC651_019182 [Populus alba x Populus x berolinensis]
MVMGLKQALHIYGLFTDTVVAYEIVFGRWSGCLELPSTMNTLKSFQCHSPTWSHGTLGLLVSAEIQLYSY